MNKFKTFLEQNTKEITFTFGRFQPATVGHQKLFDKVASIAKRGDYRIYASQSQDPKKNPLSYRDKIKFMREMFPKHARAIREDAEVKNALDVLFKLYKEGYTDVNFVVGSDRVPAFQFLKKYNGVEAKGNFYKFDTINIVSAGERDPDADDVVSAMSASKLREAAANGEYSEFGKGMPKGYNYKNLFNAVRRGMGMDPIENFHTHIQLPQKSEIREQYIKGTIFNVGDNIRVLDTNITERIKSRGPNFVICESGEKYFIDQIVESLSSPGIEKAAQIILKYLRRKTGTKKMFYSIGAEEFTNSNGSGFGVRFFAPGKKIESFRFNWKSVGGGMNNLHSIDVWTSGKTGPDNRIEFQREVSLVQVLPQFAEIFNSGKVKTGPIRTLARDVSLNEEFELNEEVALLEMAANAEDIYRSIVNMIVDNNFSKNKIYQMWKTTGVKIFDALEAEFSDLIVKQGRGYQFLGNNGSELTAAMDKILDLIGSVQGRISSGSSSEKYKSNPEIDKLEADKEKLSYETQIEDLQNLIKLTVSGASNALFVAGRGGIGKTHTVEETLSELGMKDGNGYFKNTGTASSVGIYSLLFKYKNDIILFDDSDDALKDQQSRNIIKAATDTKKLRKLVWNKMGSNVVDPDGFDGSDDELIDSGKIPRYFEFTGKIIFISNLSMNKLDPDGAIRTRAFIIDINPTDMEIYDFMEKIVDKIPLDGSLHLDSETRTSVVQLIRNSPSKQTANLRKLSRALNMKAGALKAGVEIGDAELTRMISRYA
jgi:hypothetical protein